MNFGFIIIIIIFFIKDFPFSFVFFCLQGSQPAPDVALLAALEDDRSNSGTLRELYSKWFRAAVCLFGSDRVTRILGCEKSVWENVREARVKEAVLALPFLRPMEGLRVRKKRKKQK